MTSVAVVIPHVPIPEREAMLERALRSVENQTIPVDQVVVAVDTDHEGPGATRTAGLRQTTTDWVVYLDDDDYLEPNCIERLLDYQQITQADVVYPWFTVDEGTDPFALFFGMPWDDAHPHIFPVTYLVRTDLALNAGGFPSREQMGTEWAPEWNGAQGGEDWAAILSLMAHGAKIAHLPERLWHWVHGSHRHFSGASW